MANTMLDGLMALAGPQLLGSMASNLGAPESAVKSGLQGGLASMLGAMANKTDQPGFLSQILGMAGNPALSGILGSLGSLATGSGGSAIATIGTQLLGSLFGSQQGAVAGALSRSSGLGSSAVTSLLSMAAPMLLGFLGKQVQEHGMSANLLGSTLKSELPGLQAHLPAGFSSLLSGGSSVAADATRVATEAASSTSRWLWPVVLAALALLGIFWFMNRGDAVVKDAASAVTDTAKAASSAVTLAVTTAANSAITALGEFFKRKLPNGVELNIPKMGIENRVIDFIEDKTKEINKTTWFDFDRLLFDTGKATLQASSQEQLENIANILKAYPPVKIKLGGYTDNVGDKAANMAQSNARANNVMKELVGLGVAVDRMVAEGYGDGNPVADNSTDEGRAKNRRISLRVDAR